LRIGLKDWKNTIKKFEEIKIVEEINYFYFWEYD